MQTKHLWNVLSKIQQYSLHSMFLTRNVSTLSYYYCHQRGISFWRLLLFNSFFTSPANKTKQLWYYSSLFRINRYNWRWARLCYAGFWVSLEFLVLMSRHIPFPLLKLALLFFFLYNSIKAQQRVLNECHFYPLPTVCLLEEKIERII